MRHQTHNLFQNIVVLCCLALLAGCYSADRQNSDVMSPQTVLANKDTLLDQVITVRGTVTPSMLVICTLMACPAENPCCNSCGADLQLCENGSCITVSGDEAGIQVGCGGNECGLTCAPFQEGTIHDISGVWRKKTSDQYMLELRSVSQQALATGPM